MGIQARHGSVPNDSLLALAETERGQVNVLQKLRHGHEVDQAVSFFATDCLVTEALRVQ